MNTEKDSCRSLFFVYLQMHLFQEASDNHEKDDKIVIFRKDLRKDILLGSEAEKKKAGVYVWTY